MKKEYNKKYDNAVRLGFNAVALALIILGIMQAFAPYMGGPDPREAEIREVMKHIVPVRPDDALAMLRDPGGKQVMLVLYASWCAPCMIEMVHLTTLMREGKLSRVKPVFLSLDYNFHALGAYLLRRDYHTLFAAYLLKGSMADLENALKSGGSGFNGHIPYIGIFDAQGKLITERYGTVDTDTLLQMVEDFKGR